MTERVNLDYNNMIRSASQARGIAAQQLDDVARRFAGVHAQVEAGRAAQRFGFFDLPNQQELLDRIRSFAHGVGQAFDCVIVLGIGGSALGAFALQQALLAPHWNELSDEGREYYPRLYILDNIDPTTIAPFLDRLDLRRTLVNVISKSGATAETMAQYLIVRERLVASLDEAWRRHVLFTTDPEKGVLRRLATEEAIPVLPVPPNVGGRFSVLSAVGLLPAALVGIDVDALLAGAAQMDARCRTPDFHANPAAIFAALQHLAHTTEAAPIHVMMPYSDRLYGVADWFRQLWAESLGKQRDRQGRDVFRGPTPVKAVGATDQHSQVQLYMEGPFDKTITFLSVRSLARDLAIPPAYPQIDELGYLGRHSLGELLDAERRATRAALTRAGRMNMTIELPALDANRVGQLLMMLQVATVYAGELYDVDPLDQPGVELGKQLTYGLMGRAGFAAPQDPPGDPRFVCA